MNRASLAGLAAGAQPASFQPGDAAWRGGGSTYSAAQIGLWVFMGVVCSLFVLFSVAYMMRIGYGDWRPAPLVPWQLWLSTALLGVGSVSWHMAARAHLPAVAGAPLATAVATNGAKNGTKSGTKSGTRASTATLRWCMLAWLSAVGFLASQLGGWHALTAQQYLPTASPGAGFFYMLTGLHGLHVLGGMVAAAVVTAGLRRRGGDARSRSGLALCAQYWHLLLVVWLALFGLLFSVTPELVQAVCASVGIGAR